MSIGISATSTFATKRPAGSVSGYSSRYFACAFLSVSYSILATVARMASLDVEEARREQTEAGMDIQKAGQLAGTAQNWAYLSLPAMLIWKVTGATWKQCTPVAAPPELVPENPFSMAGAENGWGSTPCGPSAVSSGPGCQSLRAVPEKLWPAMSPLPR